MAAICFSVQFMLIAWGLWN